MSLTCSRNEIHKNIWTSLVILTIAGCGIFLYVSYIYRGTVAASCFNCGDAVNPAERLRRNCQRVCSSKECVFASDYILGNMNRSADPCENFYSFTCGNYIEKFGQSDNSSVMGEMEITMKLAVREILDNMKAAPGSVMEKMKTVYDSCMSDTSSEVNAVPAALDFLGRVGIRNWPNLPPDFEFTQPAFEKSLGLLASHHEFSFVSFSPSYFEDPDPTNGLRSLTVAASLSYLTGNPERDEILKETGILILNYFEADGEKANSTWQEFLNIDAGILQLEVDSSSANSECENECETSYMYVNCSQETEDLKSLCTIVDLVVDLAGIADTYSTNRIYVKHPDYVKSLFPLLANYTQRSLANYLALRFFIAHLDDLNIFFRRILHLQSQDHNFFTSYKISLDQWQHCVDWISHFMPQVMGLQYLREKLIQKSLDEIQDLFNVFTDEAATVTFNQSWIQKEKRRAMKFQVGNVTNTIEFATKELLNETRSSEIYKEFHPTKNSFLQNVLDYGKNKFTFSMRIVKSRDTNTGVFLYDPFIVDAFHSSGAVDLGFGMFLPPVYQYGRPRLLNFATMGTSIGHELGHEIVSLLEDDEDFDNETRAAYLKKKECFESQYFTFETGKIGKKVKGNQTIDENAADSIGMKLAQKVWERILGKMDEGAEFTLPGLNFSMQQLFYISLAQMWCTVRSKELEEMHYERDVHAPPEIRINGMVQNSNEFSDAFNCPPGSPMNPIHKCSYYES